MISITERIANKIVIFVDVLFALDQDLSAIVQSTTVITSGDHNHMLLLRTNNVSLGRSVLKAVNMPWKSGMKIVPASPRPSARMLANIAKRKNNSWYPNQKDGSFLLSTSGYIAW